MAIRLPNIDEGIRDYDILQTNEINAQQTLEQTNLTLLNSWTTHATWSTPRAKRDINFVYIQGFVTGGTTGRPGKVATLPSGYLPPKFMKFLVAPNTVVQLDTNGDIWVESGSTNNVFLDGISFSRTD